MCVLMCKHILIACMICLWCLQLSGGVLNRKNFSYNLFFFIPGLMQLLGMRYDILIYNCDRKTGSSNLSTLLCLMKAILSPTEMFTPGRISYQVRHCTATQTE